MTNKIKILLCYQILLLNLKCVTDYDIENYYIIFIICVRNKNFNNPFLWLSIYFLYYVI